MGEGSAALVAAVSELKQTVEAHTDEVAKLRLRYRDRRRVWLIAIGLAIDVILSVGVVLIAVRVHQTEQSQRA